MAAQVFFLSYGNNGVATDRHGNTERGAGFRADLEFCFRMLSRYLVMC